MRKFKKALSVALVTAMAFTSLTACSKNNNAGNGETTTTTVAPTSSSAASTDGETETTKTAAADRHLQIMAQAQLRSGLQIRLLISHRPNVMNSSRLTLIWQATQ